ncbi:MAG: Tetratricopeptide repeat protein [Methanosaeta sp. PtaU1.Bin112]|nr:MAG: Tetratricopeptide repeat protein [Methanosaeta sp. PtaU1.Bin112]
MRDVLRNMGKAYFHLGEYDKAIDYCERALKASRKFGDKQREAQALFTLGNVSESLGHQEEAIRLAQSALAIFEEIESRPRRSGSQGPRQMAELKPSQAIPLSPRPASTPS